MARRRPFLTIGFCFLWTHLVAIPADAGVPKDNPVPDVRMDDTRDPHGSTAVFWLGNRRESLVDVRLDGVKLVVRSIGGDAPVRIVIDHLPPGRHRVTFRFAHPDQYEFGAEKVFQVRVSGKIRPNDPGKQTDQKVTRQGIPD